MTDAPEKIWIGSLRDTSAGVLVAGADRRLGDSGIAYISEALAQAMVAAALEDAAFDVHVECWSDGDGGRATDVLLAEKATTVLAIQAIKAATPDDARAALEARDKRVREDALREAAEKLGNLHDGFTYRPRDMKRHVLQMIDRTAE